MNFLNILLSVLKKILVPGKKIGNNALIIGNRGKVKNIQKNNSYISKTKVVKSDRIELINDIPINFNWVEEAENFIDKVRNKPNRKVPTQTAFMCAIPLFFSLPVSSFSHYSFGWIPFVIAISTSLLILFKSKEGLFRKEQITVKKAFIKSIKQEFKEKWCSTSKSYYLSPFKTINVICNDGTRYSSVLTFEKPINERDLGLVYLSESNKIIGFSYLTSDENGRRRLI